MHAQAKMGEREDGSTDLTERLNTRITERGEAEDMDVAEISANQEDEIVATAGFRSTSSWFGS